MGRLQRFSPPGTMFHVMARGNGGQPIFRDADDLAFFAGWLRKVKLRLDFRVFAYCPMSTHVHLLIETGAQPIGDVMHRVLGVYARRFNVKHARVGNLFQTRFKAIACQDDRYFAALLRYIHRNPVAAGLVKSPADWKHSGHRDITGSNGPGVIDVAEAIARLVPDGKGEIRDYLALFDASESENPLTLLLERSAAEHGVTLEDVKFGSRTALVSQARRSFAAAARKANHRNVEIARTLDCSPAAVCQMLSSSKSLSGCLTPA